MPQISLPSYSLCDEFYLYFNPEPEFTFHERHLNQPSSTLCSPALRGILNHHGEISNSPTSSNTPTLKDQPPNTYPPLYSHYIGIRSMQSISFLMSHLSLNDPPNISPFLVGRLKMIVTSYWNHPSLFSALFTLTIPT